MMRVGMRLLLGARASSEVVLAVALAAVVAAMLVPLPAWLLDAGLALNLAVSAALLVAALSARGALSVTAFPTLLLVTTLFRLALNVSSTRLALADGHAGAVIEAFGTFVVQGNYLVGAVVFAILTLVQFLVVAKGAERVAEVGARFTLDAMPGKQMSIDADLRAGAIDQAQAGRRRRDLERESQLFGAMDGAMKFVKGDVLAGLVITAVNLVGGTAVGVLQQGRALGDAAAAYALIAIGDGLASQLPSLCIAVAAGLVVTRVGGGHEDPGLGEEIGAQFFGAPRVLGVVAGLCAALGLVPGMPHLTFFGLAAGLGGLAWVRSRAPAPVAAGAAGTAAEAAPAAGPAARPAAAVGVAPVELELAPDLTPLVEERGGAFVHETLDRVRDAVFYELGVRVPGIRVRTHAGYLAEGEYRVLLDDVPAGGGRVAAGALYALAPPQELAFLQVSAEPAVEPATGRPAARVPPEARARVEAAQVSVREAGELVADHLRTLLLGRAPALLGLQDVQHLLEGLEAQAPALVREALARASLPLLTDVLRRLLQEGVSVRNLRAILEAVTAPGAEGADAAALAERCRRALQRYLTHKYAPRGPLFVFLVDPEVEDALRDAGPDAPPAQAPAILEGVERIARGGRTVLLTAPDVRRPLRRLLEGRYPEVAVLTYAELDPGLQVRPVGRLAAAA